MGSGVTGPGRISFPGSAKAEDGLVLQALRMTFLYKCVKGSANWSRLFYHTLTRAAGASPTSADVICMWGFRSWQ
ncbi:hypothetical protein J6590_010425 [Homalodisca vitripennis]|nr:hypothetical protein J6590_010425 [Homalodisca vitripennis]